MKREKLRDNGEGMRGGIGIGDELEFFDRRDESEVMEKEEGNGIRGERLRKSNDKWEVEILEDRVKMIEGMNVIFGKREELRKRIWKRKNVSIEVKKEEGEGKRKLKWSKMIWKVEGEIREFEDFKVLKKLVEEGVVNIRKEEKERRKEIEDGIIKKEDFDEKEELGMWDKSVD